MDKKKMRDYITLEDKKRIGLIITVSAFFIFFFSWFMLDTRTADITGLNLPRLIYCLVCPLFSLIYGIASCVYTKKLLLPNIIYVIANLAFTAICLLIVEDSVAAILGLVLGVSLSLGFSLITKLVLYITEKVKKNKGED